MEAYCQAKIRQLLHETHMYNWLQDESQISLVTREIEGQEQHSIVVNVQRSSRSDIWIPRTHQFGDIFDFNFLNRRSMCSQP